MVFNAPLWFSRQLLWNLDTQISLYHAERLPRQETFLVISNHRSFLDAPLLMVALQRPIRFACHRYMGQVPVLRELVQSLGCFPLDSHHGSYQALFEQASQILMDGQTVGIFPEGAQPMVHQTSPGEVGSFQRGFVHALLRSPAHSIKILPVAIASCDESVHSVFPVRMLQWFDPSEPLFDQTGWHPMVVYHRVNIMVGQPVEISASDRDAYRGRHARTVVHKLTDHCREQIQDLLHQGFQV